MSWPLFFAAGAGGFIGTVIRYAITLALAERMATTGFPWATLFVNLMGCFVLGALLGYSFRADVLLAEPYPKSWKVFLSTGICGGFTTFSAFSAEAFFMLQNGNIALSVIYITGSVAGGLAAMAAGFLLVRPSFAISL
jgi:fluoride exporter